jgi:hypothetical protein
MISSRRDGQSTAPANERNFTVISSHVSGFSGSPLGSSGRCEAFPSASSCATRRSYSRLWNCVSLDSKRSFFRAVGFSFDHLRDVRQGKLIVYGRQICLDPSGALEVDAGKEHAIRVK